jgi:RHS repeat-associated protein
MAPNYFGFGRPKQKKPIKKSIFVRPTIVMLVFLLLVMNLIPLIKVTAAAKQDQNEATEAVEPPTESDQPIQEPKNDKLNVPEISKPEKTKPEQSSDSQQKKDKTEALSSASLSDNQISGPNVKNLVIQDKTQIFNVDHNNGALNYSYAINTPIGRNGLQPSLNLSYNSQNSEQINLFGYGWGLDIPSISRMNKKGVDQLYTSNYFSSSLDGELVPTTATTYKAKVENGSFRTYDFSNNYWVVKEKNGLTYKFGTTVSEREDDPSDSTKIYRWYIQDLRDTNDNYIKYEYYKDFGILYPARIVYTGNGTTDGIFEINFIRTVSRADVVSSGNHGYTVKGNFLVSEINIKVNNFLARKYAFVYSSGDNSKRSLLSTITETGYDDAGTPKTLPAISFDYTIKSASWTKNSSYVFPNGEFGRPISFSNENGNDIQQIQIADVNGDGLTDFYESRYATTGPRNKIYLNQGNGIWVESSVWNMPTYSDNLQYMFTESGLNRGFRVADVNGDNLPDILESYRTLEVNANGQLISVAKTGMYLNNGINGWVKDNNYTFPSGEFGRPISFSNENGNDTQAIQIFDVNGDNLPDFFESRWTDTSPRKAIYINQGNGTWLESTTWQMPTDTDGFQIMFTGGGLNRGFRIADVNGDNLSDIVKSYRTLEDNGSGQVISVAKTGVYVNNGINGWNKDTTYSIPIGENNFPIFFFNEQASDTQQIQIADVNGDGFSDFFESRPIATGFRNKIYINQGNGAWVESTIWDMPIYSDNLRYMFTESGLNRGFRVADVNGDNLPDIIESYRTLEDNGSGQIISVAKTGVYINNSYNPDLLSKVNGIYGGNSVITYKTSTNYSNGSALLNPKLPYVLQTVSQITQNDGLGLAYSRNYQYEDGQNYFNGPFDHQFGGFAKIKESDSSNNSIQTYYHQGNSTDSSNGEFADHYSKIGKPYKIVTANSADEIYSVSINQWENADLGSGSNFVKLTQVIDMSYDGGLTHKDKAETYSYNDSDGNMISKSSYGEVTANTNGTYTDIGSDKYALDVSYVNNAELYIIGLPYQEVLKDQSATKISESKYYYDSLVLGSVNKGNLTKKEDWKSGTSYINTQKAYNSFGLVTVDTDPRGKTTQYIYDTYNLYPITVTNAINHVTQFNYDYTSGKVKQKTDSNTRVYQTVYDGLDRVIEEKQPDLVTPTNLVTKAAYTYTDTPGSVNVKTSNLLDASTAADSYVYFDGLGRKIQERSEAEGSNFTVKDYIYDSRGLLLKESFPYFSSGSAKTSPATDTSLFTTYSHDSLSRVVNTTNSLGSAVNAYNNWKLAATDLNGKTKDLYKDAYDNLVRVDEHNGASTYSTYYQYNGLKNLTKIIDAAGNIRNFTYDGLGRRLTAQDLHASTDTTFGTWTYTYDDAGNLITTVDPKSQTVTYTYDNINRQLTENYAGQAGTEVTNTYDAGIDGKGKLTSVIASGANTTYTYNPLGLLKQETKTISGVGYPTSYLYDRMGNQINITNPDGSQVKHIYNSAGLLEQTQRKETTDAAFINVVSNYNYGPHGKITSQDHQNGTTTTNTYDAAKLYRLANKTTTLSGGSKVQDLTYTYDPNGNITKIVDASSTNSAKTVDYTYDDLNRLLSTTASNVAAGQQPYIQTYTYDAIGNITYKSDQGTYSYEGNIGSNYANPHAVTKIVGAPAGTSTELLTTPWNFSGNNSASEKYQTVPLNILNGKVSITVTYNLHGLCALGNDASAIIFDQNGWKFVSLSNYGQNCYDGQQVVTIPLSDFAGLNTAANLDGSLHSRFWYGSSFAVDITSIKINSAGGSGITTNYIYDRNGNLISMGGSTSLAWYNATGTWTDRKQITIDESKISGSTSLTDFPFLFSVTDPSLKTVANGGKVGKTDGSDILFTSGDGVTKLAHEIEKYVPTTGEVIAWIKIPSLSATTNTKLLIYYGNAAAANQQNRTGTWNTNYKGVWHVNNALTDSTVNAKNLTNSGSTNTTAGKIGEARAFDGISQLAYTTSLPTVVTNNFTLSAWVKPNEASTTWQVPVSNGSDNGSSGGGYAALIGSGNWQTLFNMVVAQNSGVAVDTASWSQISIVRNNGTTTLYKNGVAIGSTFTDTPLAPVSAFAIGAQLQNSTPTFHRFFNGTVDEARISASVRSADWINAEYNNQSSPSTFFSYGAVLQGGDSLSWDYNNRMTQAVVGGVASTYAYDQTGQRVKLSNGTTTTYYPSGFYNIEGANRVKHILTPSGETLATVKGTGAAATVFTVAIDHLTGSNVVTNASGTLEELMDYYPFGSMRLDQKAGSFNEQRKFTGYEFDSDTGLNYANARYYNSGIGRFISQDPIFVVAGGEDQVAYLALPQIQNSYSYALNNPLMFTDPTGEGPRDMVRNTMNGVWQFSQGFGNSIVTNFSFGVGRRDRDNGSYQAGQFAGDVVSTVAGAFETAAGIVTSVGGGALTVGSGGTAAIVGVPTAAAGVAVAAHGASASYNGAKNATDTIVNLLSGRGGGSSRYTPPTQREINAVKSKWGNTTFKNVEDSIKYHYEKHYEPGVSLEQMTKDAQNTYKNYKSSAIPELLGDGSQGWKIKVPGTSQKGLYDTGGKIIYYLYE